MTLDTPCPSLKTIQKKTIINDYTLYFLMCIRIENWNKIKSHYPTLVQYPMKPAEYLNDSHPIPENRPTVVLISSKYILGITGVPLRPAQPLALKWPSQYILDVFFLVQGHIQGTSWLLLLEHAPCQNSIRI